MRIWRDTSHVKFTNINKSKKRHKAKCKLVSVPLYAHRPEWPLLEFLLKVLSMDIYVQLIADNTTSYLRISEDHSSVLVIYQNSVLRIHVEQD